MLLENLVKKRCSSGNVLMAALVLVGLVAFCNWSFTPYTNYLMAADKYDSVADALSRKNKIIRNNVRNKQKELKQLQGKLETVNQNFFEPIEADEFFNSIQRISEEVNCTIYSLNFLPIGAAIGAEPLSTDDYLILHEVTLTIMGSYRTIVALINKLQDHPKQVWIDSISIKSTANENSHLKCDLAIKVYISQNKELLSHD
jgi:Tfp pilus assembly protein PilO